MRYKGKGAAAGCSRLDIFQPISFELDSNECKSSLTDVPILRSLIVDLMCFISLFVKTQYLLYFHLIYLNLNLSENLDYFEVLVVLFIAVFHQTKPFI